MKASEGGGEGGGYDGRTQRLTHMSRGGCASELRARSHKSGCARIRSPCASCRSPEAEGRTCL